MKKTIQIEGLSFTRGEDGDGWCCETSLNGWNGPEKPCDVVIEIDTDDEFSWAASDVERQPTEAQVAAVKFLLENQSRIIERVLDASLCWARYFMQNNEDWFDDDDAIESLADLRDNLGGLDILVRPQAVDGFAWIGFSTDCEWDEEHGLGIAVWKDIVIDVGQADVSFSTPCGGFDEVLPVEEKEIREHLLSSLEEQEQQAEAAYLASLPDSVKLVHAICIGDGDEVQRLKQGGAKVSEVPAQFPAPIFMAIQSQDPTVVATIIDEGASLSVKNEEGQTPVEFAEQMVENFRITARMQAGDTDAINAMLGGLLGGDSSDPLQSIQDTLDEIRGLGGEFAEAAQDMGELFDALTGELPSRVDGGPAPRDASHDDPRQATLDTLEQWQQILKTLKQST